MPNYDPELQTHFRLWLDGEEVPFPEGSARFVQGSIEPIDGAVSSRRTVNGTLRVQADPAFRKFRLTVSCTDSMLPALFGIDPTAVATIWSPVVVRERGTTPSRTPVSGSLVAEDDWIEYRPILTGYLTSIPSLSEPEWQSDASWSLVFEESVVPTVYFVTLAGVDLVTLAPGGSLSFNLGVLTAANTGLPVTYARVSGAFPPGVSLNASTGMITGNPSGAGLYTFTIRATSGGQTGEQTYSILVNAASAPRVSFAAVAQQDYVSGVSFGLNLAPSVDVENSSAVPVFAVVSGSLPPGLSLSTSGAVFGTPTGYGPFAAQVRAIIASGEFAVQTIAFDAAVPSIVSNGVALQNYTVGSAYSLDLSTLVDVANTTYDPVFALVLGSLPAGLTLTDGVLSGTPTAYGAFAATFSATLPSGASTEVSVALFQLSPDNEPDAVLSGGTAQTWVESGGAGSTTYDAQDFTSSGILTVTESGWVEYILVGSGAGGAAVSSTAGGGGGGAGGFRRERAYLLAGTYSVSIGAGGASGTNGNSTTLDFLGFPSFTRNVPGGGRGGTTSQAGASGASGGGGGGSSTAGGAGGISISTGFGSNGGSGRTNSNAGFQAGGGAGGSSAPGKSGDTGRGDGGGGTRVRLWANLDFSGGGGGGASSTATAGVTTNGLATAGGGNGGALNAVGQAGLANSGGGGGGAGGFTSGTRAGGVGGSGRAIFIVKRRTA